MKKLLISSTLFLVGCLSESDKFDLNIENTICFNIENDDCLCKQYGRTYFARCSLADKVGIRIYDSRLSIPR